jgi:hypothetical protein
MTPSTNKRRIQGVSGGNRLDKKKVTLFILGNALAGALIVFVAIINIFALRGAAYWAVSALSVVAGALTLYLLSSWTAKKEDPIYIGGEATNGAASLAACKTALESYLSENRSTPFFREKLQALLERIEAFSARYNNIREVITGRFGSAGLSYGKFAAPVETLREYLTALTNSLISRMRVFNEEEYSGRIGELTKANRAADATGYKELEQEYQNYATKALAAFDDAILRLDRLALEISKLGEADIEKAMSILSDLDAVIRDTQFYK